MESFSEELYRKNLKAIGNRNHVLDSIDLESLRSYSRLVRFEPSVEGMLTFSYREKDGTRKYVHSRYSPKKEAIRFVEGNHNRIEEVFISRSKKLIIYGWGCGYHIRELIERYPDLNVIVLDFNPEVIHYSFGFIDYADLLLHPRLAIFFSKEMSLISRYLREYEAHTIILFKPSLNLIPPELHDIKEVFVEMDLKRQTVDMNNDLLRNNFLNNVNLKLPDWSPFNELFNNIPMVLVSAGPSLEKNIALLAKAGDHALIGAVGTALKPLLGNGIKPDFFMITDPKHYTLEQLGDCSDVPAFFLSTVYSDTLKTYRGPKYLVFQEGFAPAENLAKGKRIPLVETGGSVATTLLDLMVKMGGNPVCFVGQDLAYTNNQSHVAGTHLFRRVNPKDSSVYVEDFYRKGKVATSVNLKSYLRWISRYTEAHNEIHFYNATEGGAYIDGCIHVSLQEFLALISSKNITRERELFNKRVQEYQVIQDVDPV